MLVLLRFVRNIYHLKDEDPPGIPKIDRDFADDSLSVFECDDDAHILRLCAYYALNRASCGHIHVVGIPPSVVDQFNLQVIVSKCLIDHEELHRTHREIRGLMAPDGPRHAMLFELMRLAQLNQLVAKRVSESELKSVWSAEMKIPDSAAALRKITARRKDYWEKIFSQLQ